MNLIKSITSAIFLALILALPLALLEAVMVNNIVKIYEIPYLCRFEYYHILGISFILMMTRNSIRIKENEQTIDEFLPTVINPSINRLFRIIFVWVVALSYHQIFIK